LLFEHRQKSQEFPEIPYGQFRINSDLRFLAKNSNARYTKSLRFGLEKDICSGFGSPAENLKDSLFIVREFLDAKKLRTLLGANQNSSR